MFNIFTHQGNANQNNTEISSHPSQNSCHQENKKTTNAGENIQKNELLCTIGGKAN
jgi:hypothetical protein